MKIFPQLCLHPSEIMFAQIKLQFLLNLLWLVEAGVTVRRNVWLKALGSFEMLWWWGRPAAHSGSRAHPCAWPGWHPRASTASGSGRHRVPHAGIGAIAALSCAPGCSPRASMCRAPGVIAWTAEPVCVSCPIYPPPLLAHGSEVSLRVHARECGGTWGSCGPGPLSSQIHLVPCTVHQAWCVFIPWGKSFLSSPGGRGKGRKLEAPSVPRKGPAVGFSAQAPEPSPQSHPSWAISNMGWAPSNAVSFPHERAAGIWSQLICIDKNLALLSPSYPSFLCTLITKQKPGRWGASLLSFLGWDFYGLVFWVFFLVGCPFFFPKLPLSSSTLLESDCSLPSAILDASLFVLQLWCKCSGTKFAKAGMSFVLV